MKKETKPKKELKLVVVDKLPLYTDERYQKVVEEFHKMKTPFAKVEGTDSITSILHAIRKLNLSNEIWATRRRGEVFLVNSKVSGLLKTYKQKLYGSTSQVKTRIIDVIKEQPRPLIKKQG